MTGVKVQAADTSLGPITSVIHLDEDEEAILLKMFRFIYTLDVEPGVLLDCDQCTFDNLWGRLK